MSDSHPDTLLLDLIQKVATLQAGVNVLLADRERYGIIHEDVNDMRVTVAELRQVVSRISPIVDKLDGQSNQAAGVMWFGRVIWAVIGGAVLTAAGWIAHKLGLG